MIDQEIQIVQQTWFNLAKENDSEIGELFYTRLFENDPHLRNLFRNSISAHGRRFVSMMNYLIIKLDNTSVIHQARSLGRKYAEYGIQNKDYDYIKEALFWTLKKKLGERWTPDVMVSWIWFFSTIGLLMKDAGAENTRPS